jgi:diguanylate cyclase (GGDEF)-like protein
MTLALVTMTISILLLADLMLGTSGDQGSQQRMLRKQLAESLAVQTAVMLRTEDLPGIDRLLREIVPRAQELRSVGVRRADGHLVASAGPHGQAWTASDGTRSTPDQVRVPLSANGRAWGAVELAFRADDASWWQHMLHSPLLRQLVFVGLVGIVGYGMYMRRALQHLDPSAVIPERVQRAFDAMAEGVVVLDSRGRVMLANRAFRAMGAGQEGQVGIGLPLSSLPWLAAALPGDVSAHPWVRAMAERQNTSDDHLQVPAPEGQDGAGASARERRLVVSCAPISDNGGAVRGCMATFNDMTELHRTNSALKRAMEEVEAGKLALHRKNVELERLATQDMLTGCLNRRAFMDAAAPLLDEAQRQRADLGCLMLDIDHFKSINDTYGHGIGDRVITEVARVLRTSVPDGHLVGRYGGEEFCILAPGTDGARLLALAERIRAQVQDAAGARVTEQPGLGVTISIGASRRDASVPTLAALIDRADQALYRAKRGGRNRVAEFTRADQAETEAAVG